MTHSRSFLSRPRGLNWVIQTCDQHITVIYPMVLILFLIYTYVLMKNFLHTATENEKTKAKSIDAQYICVSWKYTVSPLRGSFKRLDRASGTRPTWSSTWWQERSDLPAVENGSNDWSVALKEQDEKSEILKQKCMGGSAGEAQRVCIPVSHVNAHQRASSKRKQLNWLDRETCPVKMCEPLYSAISRL